MNTPFIAAPLLLLLFVLVLAGAAVFVVLVMRRRPSRGFEVQRPLPSDEGDRRQ